MLLEAEKEELIKMDPVERRLWEKEHTFSEVIRIPMRATYLPYLSLTGVWDFEAVWVQTLRASQSDGVSEDNTGEELLRLSEMVTSDHHFCG